MSRKLFKSTAITGGMTFLSRVSGLVRDMVFASLVGAGATGAADAFYVAFRIPNFLRRIFGEGALSQAFVPVFSQYRARADDRETRDFIDHMTGVLGVVLFGVTAAGVVAAPILVTILAPGFLDDPEKYSLTVQMLRITFPYLLFISLAALAGGILNTYGKFGAAAFTPVLLNASLIGAAVWLAPGLDRPVVGLAWGVFIGGLAQLLFQLPFLRRIGLLPRPRVRLAHEGVRRVGKLMLPAIFGVSVAQINLLVNTLLASFLVTGSVSWLYYSDRLMEFPLGVFGIALATVILPGLSRRHAAEAPEAFSHLLDWALRWTFVIGIPASLGLMVLAGPLLTTLFHHGAFDERDVTMSAHALIAFAAGLVGFILVKVLAPGFYARQDTQTPVRVGMIAIGANIILSLSLVYPLAHVGLALAVSIAAFLNAALLFRILRQKNIYQPLAGWGRFMARVSIAAAAMVAILWFGAGDPTSWLRADTLERILRLCFWIGIGVVTYGGVLVALGLRFGQLRLKHSDGAHDD